MVKFDAVLYVKLKMVSQSFRQQVNQSMDELCNGVENMFVSAYFETLYFQRSFTWVKPIQFCGEKGVRIDRVFECEVQAIPNHTLTIACKFSLYNDKKIYRAEYKFDAKSQRGQRETWVHVDR